MKSQISVFIIIGLALVLIISLLTLKFQPEIISTTNDSKKVTVGMESCLNDITISGLGILGRQGMIFPTTYLASDELKIAYFYFKGKRYMPTLNQYEAELTEYINENIYDCVKKQKYSIETNELPQTSVSFADKVTVSIDYPMVIRSKSGESTAEKFYVDLNFNFTDIYYKVEKVINSTVENPEWIYLDGFSDDQSVKLIRVDKNTLIYVIKKEGKFPFEYRYAVKYT